MADQTGHDLKYGHLGRYIYNNTDKAWLARRTFGSPYALQPLAPSQWAVKPTDIDTERLLDAVHHTEHTKPSRRVAAYLPSLVRQRPTIAPAVDLASSFVHLSREINAVTTHHDPTVGDLLAFGRASDHSTRRTLEVAAFPARTSPSILCLTQVQPQKQGWDQNKGIWIDVSRIGGESATWNASQPIRQLCFCLLPDDPHASNPFLAVRTSAAVHILRFALRKNTTSRYAVQMPSNRFHVTSTHCLNLDVLGGVPPADVAFNPFYDKQIATIDQNGTWRVWDLSRQPIGQQGKPLELASGAAADQHVAADVSGGRVIDDGWGRILWGPDTFTIIAASRRAISIYDVSGKPLQLSSPDLGIRDTPHWILDVKAGPQQHPVVFVLTSLHLICLRMQGLSTSERMDLDTAGAQIIFRTAHFRDPEDISLRITTLTDDEDIVVLIRSSLSLVATTYRCQLVQTSTRPFLSVSDPILLTLPENPTVTQALCPAIGLHVQIARYGEGYRGPVGPGEIYRDSSIRFYMMTQIFADMSIVEKLYYGRPEASNVLYSSTEVLPTTWHGRLTHGAPRLQSKRFVVDDDDVMEDFDRGAMVGETLAMQLWPTMPKLANVFHHSWTTVYEKSYNKINTADQTVVKDFSDVLDMVKETIVDGHASRTGVTTWYDLGKYQVSVGDLDEATAQYHRLLLNHLGPEASTSIPLTESSSRPRLASLASPRVLGLPTSAKSHADPTVIYDRIIKHWLAPLSQRVPGRVRLAREQLARRIVGELCLASTGMRGPALDQSQDEPMEGMEAPESPVLRSSQLQGSFPTPSPTATPSLTTVTSLSSHPSTLASVEYLRLQRYTTFSTEKTTPAPLPRGLAKKLAHWSVGGNPDEYDWLALQRQQEKEAEEDDEDLGPKERARLKRRAEKHLRKQRRETLKAATVHLASSQAPEVMSASQPASLFQRHALPPVVAAGVVSQGPLLSSSQANQSQSQQLPFSQVLPGKFGGAPPKKKRKRNEGF